MVDLRGMRHSFESVILFAVAEGIGHVQHAELSLCPEAAVEDPTRYHAYLHS